ncbi:uncharacterized protein LOC134080639 isoform X2 [Sardina pilchardus]
MKKTVQNAERSLRELDQNTENLMLQQHQSDEKRKQCQLHLDNLETKLEGENNLLNNAEDALKQANKHLQTKKDELQRQHNREKTAAIVTGVGLGLTIIPVVGWVAGPIIAIGGAIELDEAEKAIRDAKEEVAEEKSRITTYSDRISDYQSKIKERERQIRQTDEDLNRIRQKLSEIQCQREAMAKFQQKMRSAVHLLGHLNGPAHVLELQTRRSILLEPVTRVMEELVKVACEIPGNQILRDEVVMSLVRAVREKEQRLAAICASHNSSALERYM